MYKSRLVSKQYLILVIILLAGFFVWIFSLSAKGIYLRGRIASRFSRNPIKSQVMGLEAYRLELDYHRQEQALSCEVAALKMALDAVGVEVGESELRERLVYDRTPKSRGIWGDPYAGFVGDIDGKMGVTGYGVYWQPIEQLANKYVHARHFEHASPQLLAEHLSKGRPIVYWGYYGRGEKLAWKTPEGKEIQGVRGEHARTLVGFVGSKEEPVGFYIYDPIYGELFWETEKLMQNSAPFQNSGVVLFPKLLPVNQLQIR